MRPRPDPVLAAGALALLALAAAPPAAAQVPSPSQAAPRVAAIPLDPPDVELGEEFHDEEYGFVLRLPKGMSLLPPAELESWRADLLVPEDQLQTIEGERARVQGWLFKHAEQPGNIFVLMNEPPVTIDSPTQLRQSMARELQSKGRPYEHHGKLYEFKARGARAGFLISLDYGLEAGKPMGFRQHVAYLRGPERSFLVRYTAPIEEFDALGEPFKASMITFAVERGTRAPLRLKPTPTKEPALGSPRSIANLVLLVLLAAGGLYWWRRSSAPAAGDA